jgi:hypothetical protein
MRAVPLLCFLLFTVAARNVTAQITTRTDAVGQKLNAWFAEGESAGLHALSYENRDGGHSIFEAKNYPQLSIVQPTEEEWAQKKNVGPASMIRPEPVFGNCSMSAPADKGGSLPRLYLSNKDGLNFLAAQYLNNNFYFYPEHQDYDPGYNGRGGWGDLYPANVPFVLISQGSSFSDLPFIQAFFSAAAALPKETQQGLISNKLLIPTLQSIFRRSNHQVQTEEDYFTGKAHPPVFDGGQINEEKMITIAHDMSPSRVPPLPVLHIINETTPTPNRDFFESPAIQSEVLGTTPFAIARAFRGSAQTREMIVSASKSADILKRKLTFRWALLQGDPDKVNIESNADGSEAKITVQWHPGWEFRPGFQTHRVDIGLFAHNGFAWSAPAIISYYMLPNEQRFYDSAGRLQEICYQAGNPDLGLPASTDLRWLALARRLGSKDNDLSIQLLRDQLPATLITHCKTLAAELEPLQASWRKLQGDPQFAEQAATAQQNLQSKVQQALDQPLAPDNLNTIQRVRDAINRIADHPQLFITHQAAAGKLMRDLPESNVAPFNQALQHALNMLVLAKKRDGGYQLHYPPEKLSPGEVYQLRQLNLALLRNLLFYDFLDQSTPFAFTNEMLTTVKPWRDIYTTSADGGVLSWARVSGGRVSNFDKDGKLILPSKVSVKVNYTVDAASRLLQFSP